MTTDIQQSAPPDSGMTGRRWPDWRDDGWPRWFPQLGAGEQHRRLHIAHRLMARHDLDCLVLASPAHSHDFVGHYFSGEANPTVVIPRSGIPVA